MRYRLRTLLILMVWVGFVLLSLRTPTALWSGVISVLTLLAVLLAVLLVIYRTERTRAMAIGFLVFCVGYLAYVAFLSGTLGSGLSSHASMPVGRASLQFFFVIHPDTSGIPRRYDVEDFIAICNHAVACLLGIAGAITAQLLHATAARQAH
jgi:hypothetical protein